ncbi:MAG: hypothetical protein LBW77_07715 [Verrucomicrobiota bacterium]|jgi:DNA-binding Lrp family transcriptional regulator|nr:hypothetical protein [Verrucomicrobiota bacterium]
MTTELNEQEAAALVALQRGIAVTERPFAELGAACGLSETAVLDLVRRLQASGDARRFGAVFDGRRFGYRSALCAMTVPRARLDEVAGKAAAVRGVTHVYERGWPEELSRELPGGPGGRSWPNLWFTLSSAGETFVAELETLRAACQPYAIHELPATRRFKIDVVFDLRTRERDERVEPRQPPEQEPARITVLDAAERAVVRSLQGDVPVCARFYQAAAERLGLTEDGLTGQLRAWQASGVLRRIGLLLRHREIGFKANGMCCWEVPEAEMVEAGRRVAACPEVTHCYARPRMDVFPFRLYAMIHTMEWRTTQRLYERITREAGLADGQLLLSVKEFKKTSVQFF